MASEHQRLIAEALLKAERKLKAIKKHYNNRPKVVHAPLWFMKLGKILEAEG